MSGKGSLGAADPRRVQAIQLHQAGRLAEAEPLYRALLAANPGDAEILRLLGYVELQTGRAALGAQTLGRAAAMSPKDPKAQVEWGDALLQAGLPDRAAQAFRAAIKLRPGFPEALRGLGVALASAGRREQAVKAFRDAAAAQPNDPSFWHDLGQALRVAGRPEEAVEPLRRAVAMAPDFAAALYNLAGVLQALGLSAEAAEPSRRAAALAPDWFEAQLLRSATAYADWSLEEAAAAGAAAVRLNPQDAGAQNNLGVALYHLGRLDEAEPHLRRAVALVPESPGARHSLSHLLLKQGRFEEGWREYEWRLKTDDAPARPAGDLTPLWQGQPLAGKTLRIEREQGAGDMLQFVRLASAVAAQGARVLVWTDASMSRLMATVPGVAEVCSDERSPPAHYYCPVMSLPHRLGLRLETLPAEVPYLSCPPEEVARWGERIGTGGFRIGLVWRGNLAARSGRARALPLAALAPLARIPGVRLISLQKATDQERIDDAPADMRIEALGPDFHVDDWTTTAAAVMNLDLVICCDTGVGHLAGALGRPVWIAQPHVTEWRWLTGRDDSPWYPQHRLFRQPAPGDWASVVGAMAQALSERLA